MSLSVSRRVSLSLLFCIALTGAAASSRAQTVPAPLPDPLVQVTAVQAQDDDLVFAVDWHALDPLPSSATLVVEASNGSPKASQPITPTPGVTQIPLVDVLVPTDLGKAFRASVVDASTQQTLAALPFDIALQCPDPYNCVLQARPGVGAAPNVPVISPMLQAELTASASTPVGAAPQPDVLGNVMMRRPDLTGEVYTYADKLAKITAGASTSECKCSWTVVPFDMPATATRLDYNNDPAFHRGDQGPGAAHWFRAWYDGGVTNATHSTENYVEGQSEATMRLRCWRTAGWREIVIRILWWEYRLRMPILEGECPKPCAGTVTNHGEYYADVRAWVDTGWWGDGEGAAQEEGRYSVNGTTLINRIARVGKEVRKEWAFSLAVPGLGSVTTDNGKVTYDGATTQNLKIEIEYSVNGNDGSVAKSIVSSADTTVGEPATALFEAKSLAYALGSSDTDSEGKATMSYLYTMYGSAACAVPQTASYWNYHSYAGRTQQLQINIRKFFGQFGVNVNP